MEALLYMQRYVAAVVVGCSNERESRVFRQLATWLVSSSSMMMTGEVERRNDYREERLVVMEEVLGDFFQM